MVCRSRQSLATSLLEVGAGLKGGAVLTVRHWLSACTSPGRRAIGWFLMVLSLSLIVGCSGGSGGDSGDGSGGGSDNGGSGNGGGAGDSLEAQWSITPFTGGLRIEWHNLANFSQANNLQRISINITEQGSSEVQYSINITDFVDGIYNLTSLGSGMDLEEGEAYKFTSLVLEYSDHSTDTVTIDWQLPANESDHGDAGNGTVVGEDHDGDGWANSVDPDDDNDGLVDDHRTELLNNTAGVSCSLLADCDRDGLGDNADNCPATANSDQLDTDNDTTGDVCDGDKDGDSVVNGDEVMGCELLADCDGDTVGDNADNCPLVANSDQLDTDNDTTGDVCDEDKDGDSVANGDEVMGCELNSDCDDDGEPDNVDIDADGDGLIEIHNAADLDAVRYQLDGSGFKANEGAVLDQTGCGNGADITACSGYELIGDISLTDYIAANYATQGWQPIAHDVNLNNVATCEGRQFSTTFDGNGFEVSGLWIDRPQQECIGLFGQADGSIRNLGVKADRIMGRGDVGGLVGYGRDVEIVQSYAVSNLVNGSGTRVGGLVGDSRSATIVQSYAISNSVIGESARVGGLVGDGSSVSIIQSYAISNGVIGKGDQIGGLVGRGNSATIIQSYAINGRVRAVNDAGGLVGWGEHATIVQSYAISNGVIGEGVRVGGLAGFGRDSMITHSYAVSGPVSGSGDIGGLVGYVSPSMATATATYWATDTSGITNDAATGSLGRTSTGLRSPTGYDGIYAGWDDGLMVDAINDNATIWCDEDNNDMIEEDERRDDTHADGDNRIWDFGTASDYPAIRCTLDNPTDQRAWWHLNSTGQPALNQTRLDAWLDGSLP